MQGSLTEEEALCLDGEGGEVCGFKLGHGDGQKLSDLLARVALLLSENIESGLDDRVDLVLERVPETAFFSHKFVVKGAKAVSKGTVVLGKGETVRFGENDRGERTLCDAEIVVARRRLGFVRGNEALGHEEGDFLRSLGNGNVLNREVGEKLGIEEVSAAGEDGGGLIHARQGQTCWQ